MNHPNIAAVRAFHDSDGRRFIEMELVEGEDLAARLARGPLPVDEARAIAAQVAAALEAAHEQGVIHRDLKPGNILIDAEGAPKILHDQVVTSVFGDVTVVDRDDMGMVQAGDQLDLAIEAPLADR